MQMQREREQRTPIGLGQLYAIAPSQSSFELMLNGQQQQQQQQQPPPPPPPQPPPPQQQQQQQQQVRSIAMLHFVIRCSLTVAMAFSAIAQAQMPHAVSTSMPWRNVIVNNDAAINSRSFPSQLASGGAMTVTSLDGLASAIFGQPPPPPQQKQPARSKMDLSDLCSSDSRTSPVQPPTSATSHMSLHSLTEGGGGWTAAGQRPASSSLSSMVHSKGRQAAEYGQPGGQTSWLVGSGSAQNPVPDARSLVGGYQPPPAATGLSHTLQQRGGYTLPMPAQMGQMTLLRPEDLLGRQPGA
jgi:hypothetical protein